MSRCRTAPGLLLALKSSLLYPEFGLSIQRHPPGPAAAPAAALADIRFYDRERALHNFAEISKRVPAGVSAAIPPLLADLPDPDSALNLFERLTENASPELFVLFDKHRQLVHYALAVFAYSHFLGQTLIKNQDLFHVYLREQHLDRYHSREEFRESFARYRSRSFETDISMLLARFKRREYTRIMLRDVLGIATLADTTSEISALADVLVEEALRECESRMINRSGKPQHQDADGRWVETPFAVLALGKLGGNELNYSSDIDLLFLYGGEAAEGESEAEPSSGVSNREYFIRLGQMLTETLTRITAEGFVFRVDLRLRPQGREGEPAVSLAQALRYYSGTAHDWELQAMIKIRHCAGDVPLARRFIRAVQPFVYTEQINFAALETALETRDRIHERRRDALARRTSASVDVKLDRGGIRDIEFLVQCLQRVYGGNERWLRSGSTLFSLQKLHDKRHISGKEFHQLTTAYEFLRIVEHRLQLRRGQQVHRLPTGERELEIMSRSLGGGPTQPREIENVVSAVRSRMAEVAEIYERIIHHQQVRQEAAAADFQLQSPEFVPAGIPTDRQIIDRLAIDSPELYRIASESQMSRTTRRDLFKFLSAAFTSSERYAAVLQAPTAVERALGILGVSEFLTDVLIRHPDEIATLAQLPGKSAQPAPPLLVQSGQNPPASAAIADYVGSEPLPESEKLGLLRRHYRHRVFLSAARSVLQTRDLYDALADTTAAAEEAIAAALAIARSPHGFAVLALGRLGTYEFDVLSDADLIFVCTPRLSTRTATRTAEHLVRALSAYTQDGTVFAVDTRLRPGGGEGELVSSPDYLASYFRSEAQPWEALTYRKLRFIAGSEAVAAQAVKAVSQLWARFAKHEIFADSLREMRLRLEKSEAVPNLKTAPGGLYDIDFLAGFLVTRAPTPPPPCNTRDRLHWLQAAGLLNAGDCETLLYGDRLLRATEHVVRLVTGRTGKWLPVAEAQRQAVERLVPQVVQRQFAASLSTELEQVMAAVREVYCRLLQPANR